VAQQPPPLRLPGDRANVLGWPFLATREVPYIAPLGKYVMCCTDG